MAELFKKKPEKEKPQEMEDIFEIKREIPKEEIEKPLAPEKEKIPEKIPEKPKIEKIEEKPRKVIPPFIPKKKKEPLPKTKTESQIAIENILFSNLEEIITKLDQGNRIIFQKRGEEIAWEIAGLLPKIKTKVKKILQLIRNWLKMIPRINKFFLEEETKKKAQRILKIESEKKI